MMVVYAWLFNRCCFYHSHKFSFNEADLQSATHRCVLQASSANVPLILLQKTAVYTQLWSKITPRSLCLPFYYRLMCYPWFIRLFTMKTLVFVFVSVDRIMADLKALLYCCVSLIPTFPYFILSLRCSQQAPCKLFTTKQFLMSVINFSKLLMGLWWFKTDDKL